jgi:transporter family-2 protein
MRQGLVIAAIAGSLIAIQVRLLGRTADDMGAGPLSLLVAIAGGTAALIWVAGSGGWADVAKGTSSWWWVGAGALGAIAVGALGVASSRGGTTATLAVSFSGQMLVGVLIDRLAGDAVPPARAVGGAGLVLAGVFLLAGR